MNWDGELDRALKNSQNRLPSVDELMALLDLTLLDTQATAADLAFLQQQIQRWPVAAVCVYPQHLNLLDVPKGVRKASVVNFPQGNSSIDYVSQEVRLALDGGTEEIDYVFPYAKYQAGKQQEAFSHCHEISQLCRANELTFKVILETGAFTDMDVLYALASQVIVNGCDFLKTSSGKIQTGATPLAVYTLLQAIKSSNKACGIKISGGVKTIVQANQFVALSEFILGKKVDKGWFRIGASSLLQELLTRKIGQAT